MNRTSHVLIGLLIFLFGFGALSITIYSLYTGSYVYANFDTDLDNVFAQIALVMFCIWALGFGVMGIRYLTAIILSKNKGEFDGVKTFAIIFSGFIIYVAVKGILNDIKLEPFKAHITDYLSGSRLNRFYLPESKEPYIKGKVVVVDKTEKRISEVLFGIPDELRQPGLRTLVQLCG